MVRARVIVLTALLLVTATGLPTAQATHMGPGEICVGETADGPLCIQDPTNVYHCLYYYKQAVSCLLSFLP